MATCDAISFVGLEVESHLTPATQHEHLKQRGNGRIHNRCKYYVCLALDSLDDVPQGSLRLDSRFTLPRPCERRSATQCDGSVWT
jgi:hypothetical protein